MLTAPKHLRVPLAAVLSILTVLSLLGACAAERPVVIPAPLVDSQASTTQTAVFAGGCFWGVAGVFEHVRGVRRVVSGYAGGDEASAHYRTVSRGRTAHAESVEIVFDPQQVTYGKLLQIFFSVAHNPTELNAQGPDFGTQYRSVIFYRNDEQRDIATKYIEQLNQAKVFDRAVVTHVDPLPQFYPAEAYHQDFMTRNPDDPYIVAHDAPKLKSLQSIFPDYYRATPFAASFSRERL